jgi:hypothetical protein
MKNEVIRIPVQWAGSGGREGQAAVRVTTPAASQRSQDVSHGTLSFCVTRVLLSIFSTHVLSVVFTPHENRCYEPEI